MKLNWYVPLTNLAPNFPAILVVTEAALSTISCISSVDSSPNLLFSSIFFVDKTWLPEKNFMLSDISHTHFHIRSNAGIMADYRDPVNQRES